MARFKKGLSGNPAGKPKGAKDRRTELRETLKPHATALVNKCVALALDGDTTALKILIDRLIGPLKGRDETVTLDQLATGATLTDQGRRILDAVAEGRVTPDQAVALLQALAAQARIIETDELQRRIAALEQNQ